jgi:hypothetical protein
MWLGPRLGNGSRVNREIYARFCGEAQGEIPWAYSPFRNVWSAAVLQAKNEDRVMVCVNVSGLGVVDSGHSMEWSRGGIGLGTTEPRESVAISINWVSVTWGKGGVTPEHWALPRKFPKVRDGVHEFRGA